MSKKKRQAEESEDTLEADVENEIDHEIFAENHSQEVVEQDQFKKREEKEIRKRGALGQVKS